MLFQVKVRINLDTLAEFGQKLQKGELDRRLVRSATHCLKEDPAVGYSIWEADTRDGFEAVFGAWRVYYDAVEVNEVITPDEAMRLLVRQIPVI